MKYRKTEQSMHKRVAYRLYQYSRDRRISQKEILYLFGLRSHVTLRNWFAHLRVVIPA